MLQSWVSVQDRISSAPSPSDAHGETAEHREARLRALYERALSLHQSASTSATHLFQQLADELSSPLPTSPSHATNVKAEQTIAHPPPAKRPRTDTPLWQRRLLYAALRNLAEAHFASNAPRLSLSAYASALDLDPSDFLVWVRAARAATAAGHLHVARRAYESALILRPRHPLALNPLRAVLAAIPDPDDDLMSVNNNTATRKSQLKTGSEGNDSRTAAVTKIATQALELAGVRGRALQEERDADKPVSPERIGLNEASWVALVDSLIASLVARLRGHGPLVSHPAHLVIPEPPAAPQQPTPNSSSDIEEVMIVSERRAPAKRPREWEAEKEGVDQNNDTQISQQEKGAQHRADTSNTTTTAPRRSSRRAEAAAAAAADNERRRTRTFGDATDGKAADAALIQTLLRFSVQGKNVEHRKEKTTNEQCEAVTIPETPGCNLNGEKSTTVGGGANEVPGTNDLEPPTSDSSESRRTSWRRVIDEREEAKAVRDFAKKLNDHNSGPVDLLLHALSSLSELRVVQYFPTLALLWTTVRDRLQLHIPPGATEASTLIVEAMIVSGKKAGKQKAKRFQEAARLLSQISLSPTSDGDGDIFLRMRVTWLSGLLHECRGEMQLAYEAAERTLELLQKLNNSVTYILPDISGPELSGYSIEALATLITNRIARLKSARDLEKAEEELSKVGDGDLKAAQRTVSILAPSVYSSVSSLGLDKWRAIDLKFDLTDEAEIQEWEARFEAEIDLEPRVILLHDACSKSSDLIGELFCFSIRLRMAVHYYVAKVRAEADKDVQNKDSDSSTARMSDLLVQIRRYVLLIKKLTSSSMSSLWTDKPGLTGWSMADAAAIACLTVVSLTELVITTIPLLKFTNGDIEMGPAQKNRRLGFTRCMLAFPRCFMLLQKCRKVSISTGSVSDGGLSKKMLQVISFCLKALVARGCCREEGTSGALIRLYVKYLTSRLQEVAKECHTKAVQRSKGKEQENGNNHEKANSGMESFEQEIDSAGSTPRERSPEKYNDELEQHNPDYAWDGVRILRHELAQCFQCLYQIQNLENIPPSESENNTAWLEEGCKVSKHIGLSFVASEPSTPGLMMDVEVCRNIYFFYRKRIFEALCLRRRGTGKVKRIREVLAQLSESLPEEPGNGVKLLPFVPLDNIMSDVVDAEQDILQGAAENVTRLEDEWNRLTPTDSSNPDPTHTVRGTQNSTMYFEVFALHAMSILDFHDSDYKKQKNAERRKRPKEVAERLLTSSSDCLIALRSRPWSVGAWILLGRIFLEIADLALDERELCLSTFALHRPEDLATLSEGETVQIITSRAEACFAFASSLLRHHWPNNICKTTIPLSAPFVFGLACDGNESQPWFGFGDDGDLFESFGLTNHTTSRPRLENEHHPFDGPTMDSCRNSSVLLGEAAVAFLRLREKRYFYIHWTTCALESRVLEHPKNRYNDDIVNLAKTTLEKLRGGVKLCLICEDEPKHDITDKSCPAHSDVFPVASLDWRTTFNMLKKSTWYYTYLEAKLLRKSGCGHEEYLEKLNEARKQNVSYREENRQPRDIEPLYKLHVARMKILRTTEESAESIPQLKMLERYCFKSQQLMNIDEWHKDVDDLVAERRIAIAEDIISAMQACSDPRSDAQHAEFFFKGTYCKAVLLAEVLKDSRGAIEELDKVFRMDAAARALDQRQEGAHRGYFYKLWNYRFTDTGIEPSLETERKLVRWRGKLLGLYGQLLRQFGEWRLLAAIIYRLKKRSADDLPVDGAILDDLIDAYAVTCRGSIINSLEKSIVTDVAAFESSFKRTWEIYVETLRLSQGVKKVRVGMAKGESYSTGEARLCSSGRPRCLVAIHTALHLEHIRWKSARDGAIIDLDAVRQLPTSGNMKNLSLSTKRLYVHTMRESTRKWPLEEKMNKIFLKRLLEYQPPPEQPPALGPISHDATRQEMEQINAEVGVDAPGSNHTDLLRETHGN